MSKRKSFECVEKIDFNRLNFETISTRCLSINTYCEKVDYQRHQQTCDLCSLLPFQQALSIKYNVNLTCGEYHKKFTKQDCIKHFEKCTQCMERYELISTDCFLQKTMPLDQTDCLQYVQALRVQQKQEKLESDSILRPYNYSVSKPFPLSYHLFLRESNYPPDTNGARLEAYNLYLESALQKSQENMIKLKFHNENMHSIHLEKRNFKQRLVRNPPFGWVTDCYYEGVEFRARIRNEDRRKKLFDTDCWHNFELKNDLETVLLDYIPSGYDLDIGAENSDFPFVIDIISNRRIRKARFQVTTSKKENWVCVFWRFDDMTYRTRTLCPWMAFEVKENIWYCFCRCVTAAMEDTLVTVLKQELVNMGHNVSKLICDYSECVSPEEVCYHVIRLFENLRREKESLFPSYLWPAVSIVIPDCVLATESSGFFQQARPMWGEEYQNTLSTFLRSCQNFMKTYIRNHAHLVP